MFAAFSDSAMLASLKVQARKNILVSQNYCDASAKLP